MKRQSAQLVGDEQATPAEFGYVANVGGFYSMQDRPGKLTRSEFVQGTIVLPALAGLLFSAAAAPARAAKGSKTQYKYQDKPNGSKKCSNCTFFIPGSSATANGTCKIVDGTISPNGYCIAWSAKTS